HEYPRLAPAPHRSLPRDGARVPRAERALCGELLDSGDAGPGHPAAAAPPGCRSHGRRRARRISGRHQGDGRPNRRAAPEPSSLPRVVLQGAGPPRGRWRMKRAGPNIYEVAELAGVSLATVSRVISPGAKVSDKTRQKVVIAMEKLGYRPNSIAQSLATR